MQKRLSNGARPFTLDALDRRLGRLEKRPAKQVEYIVERRVEQLSIMTQRGFAEMKRNFDGVEQRLDKHEAILSNIARVLENIELRLLQAAYKI